MCYFQNLQLAKCVNQHSLRFLLSVSKRLLNLWTDFYRTNVWPTSIKKNTLKNNLIIFYSVIVIGSSLAHALDIHRTNT